MDGKKKQDSATPALYILESDFHGRYRMLLSILAQMKQPDSCATFFVRVRPSIRHDDKLDCS
jgi:hypothetical protein